MKFAVVGGDRRSVLLCSMLLRDGHRVQSFALEKAELPAEIPKAGCLQGCVYGTDCVILPTPAENSGYINAPYAIEPLRTETLTDALWKGQLLCGGRFSAETGFKAVNAGLRVADIMHRPEFAVMNAAITAEGAIERLMQNSEKTLMGSRVLVTGWGRIGRVLAQRLKALGAEVTVAERKAEHRAAAEAMGCRAVDLDSLEGLAGEFDLIANTVPARVFSDAALCCISGSTALLELASPPGGFDRALAENIGLRVVPAGGLPGIYAPYTAAELIKNIVYEIIREETE